MRLSTLGLVGLLLLPAWSSTGGAEPPFELAGTTTFTSSGSMAGRFVIEHNMSLAEMELVSEAPNTMVVVMGPRGFNYIRNEDADWNPGARVLVPGSYFIYLASTPPRPMVYTMRFENETGFLAHDLGIPIQSWMGPVTPTLYPVEGDTNGVAWWTSTQPFEGPAFSATYHRTQAQPQVYEYLEELRWSVPEGVFDCRAYSGGNGIGLNIFDQAGYSEGDSQWWGHNGTATLDFIKYNVGFVDWWFTAMYWVQRLPDDVPDTWGQPYALPDGVAMPGGYDAACLERHVAGQTTTVTDAVASLPIHVWMRDSRPP
jgi:hypothetical protein